MTINYKLITIDLGIKTIKNIKKFNTETDACLFIPFNPANTDYQEYLKWLEEGNTPLPADEPADEISE
jgi:hypothetical protein